jgi:hypothetical protein
MRVWKFTEYTPPAPATASISPRGLHLMLVEFLVRHPCNSCVMTAAPPGLAGLAGLFPGTVFHVYRMLQAEDEAVGNVVHHACVFDKDAADGWSIRHGGFNLVFLGETMDRQTTMLMSACPRVGMLLITEPPEYYVEGEMVYPLWCSPGSHLCALIASPGPGGQIKAFHYGAAKYTEGMREFQAQHHKDGDTAYDASMENMILGMYAGTQCSDPGAAMLLGEIVRVGLPARGEADIIF